MRTNSLNPSAAEPLWHWSAERWEPLPLPRLMGILNVTPDSFSDGGQFSQVEAAVAHGLQLVADGADIVDVGGESTRPGATIVSVDDELQRVIPVIERLSRRIDVPISIDTMKGAVARAALAAGASVVNDVSAGRFDPDLLVACAETDCGLILMHMQGTPQTMQADPKYGDVVSDVRDFLLGRLRACEALGIEPERIVFDPGIGFGKTTEHNIDLLTHIGSLRAAGRPVLIGHSRKRFLYKLLGRETDERLAGTIGVSISLAMQGVDILRVHDVRAVRDALRSWRTTLPGK